MSENRFAILIGMNNYKGNELPYCVKDVEDLEQTLISRCRFSGDNIFKITDSHKPVKEQIDEAFNLIEKDFKPKEDLLLFYFSGHGYYDSIEEKSKIIFEDDTELTIQDILLRYSVKITPKNQYVLIDACHSGAEVFFKDASSEKEVRRLNYLSSEICLMFATESKKQAMQHHSIENSYFTYYLMEAIKKDSLYDDDGFLTVQVIDNYIKKKVLEKSSYVQIPVSEIRSSGYKVFSFNEELIASKNKKSKDVSIEKENDVSNTENYESSFEESLTFPNREREQAKYSRIIDDVLEKFMKKEGLEAFNIQKEDPFFDMPGQYTQEIYKKIIQEARKEKLEAINDLFEVGRVERNSPSWMGSLNQMLTFLHDNSKPEYDYKIYTGSDHIYCAGIYVKSQNIYQVSCGIGVLLYPVKYGFVVALIEYNFDWGGGDDSDLKYINVTLKPFLLSIDNSEAIRSFVSQKVDRFDVDIKFLCENRKKDIEEFIKKTGN